VKADKLDRAPLKNFIPSLDRSLVARARLTELVACTIHSAAGRGPCATCAAEAR
jgi:hypothetical protein